MRCRGELHPVLGYLIDIHAIDDAVRGVLVPAIEEACEHSPGDSPGGVLASNMAALDARLGGLLTFVRWHLTPYTSVEIHMNAVSRALVRHKFEFAASHRLHVPSLTAEENRRLFGKCNYESGHGHNYIFETCVETPAGVPLPLEAMERAAQRLVIDRFDHRNLNDDPAFRPGEGLNPSVENIAGVFHGLLAPEIASLAPGVSLREITVWESERTSATYPA